MGTPSVCRQGGHLEVRHGVDALLHPRDGATAECTPGYIYQLPFNEKVGCYVNGYVYQLPSNEKIGCYVGGSAEEAAAAAYLLLLS